MKKILKNPLTVITATLIGLILGVVDKETSTLLGPFGRMYLYLLQMSVIPIIISAIISNIGRLAGSSMAKDFVVKAIVVFVFTCVLSSLLGIFGGVLFQPGGNLSAENEKILNNFIQSSDDEIELNLNLFSPNQINQEHKSGIFDFLLKIVPNNIFQSLTQGRALELVFFFIVLGIGVGMIRNETGGKMIIEIATALFLIFQKIIDWVLYFLPFGLICLVSSKVSETGTEIFLPLLKYILLFYAIGLLLLVINFLVLWKRSKTSLLNVIKATIEPNLLAFTTRSSFACIPSCVKSLEENLKFERITTNLFIPLGITLGRYGNIFYFSLTTVFIAQVYNVNLGVSEFLIIIIGSILAGFATAGATGIATLSVLSIITIPLGLPLDVILIILIALDVIIDPMRTLLIINTNLMSSSLISKVFDMSNTIRHNKT